MCKDLKEGYKKCCCPLSYECLFYGDMSQMCHLTGDTCNRPWTKADFQQQLQELNLL